MGVQKNPKFGLIISASKLILYNIKVNSKIHDNVNF